MPKQCYIVVLALLLCLNWWGCARKKPRVDISAPIERPTSDNSADINIPIKKKKEALKREIKSKQRYFNKLNNFLKDWKKLKAIQLKKREAGFNTLETEELLVKMEALIKAGKVHILENNFEELLERDIRELSELKSNTKESLKNLARFGEFRKEKQSLRKYGDERDWVAGNIGEPRRINKSERGMFPIRFTLHDASEILLSAAAARFPPCFASFGNMVQVEFQLLTDMLEWSYPEYGLTFIFIKGSDAIFELMVRNQIAPHQRDQALIRICNEQLSAGHGYKLIYAGSPRTDIHSIVDQLFTGSGRGADMFGAEGLRRRTMALAALKDLKIVSVVFNKNINILRVVQQRQRVSLFEFLNDDLPNNYNLVAPIGEFIGNIDQIKRRTEEYLKGIKDPNEREKTALLAEIIYNWQRTLEPKERDVKKLARLFPEEPELIALAEKFRVALENLTKELKMIDKELKRFRNEFPQRERTFRRGETISIFFMFEGVRFKELTLENGDIDRASELEADVKVAVQLSKKEPPIVVHNVEGIKISSPRIHTMRYNFEQLVSFGIQYVPRMEPGIYTVSFSIKDKIGNQADSIELNWVVVSENNGTVQ